MTPVAMSTLAVLTDLFWRSVSHALYERVLVVVLASRLGMMATDSTATTMTTYRAIRFRFWPGASCPGPPGVGEPLGMSEFGGVTPSCYSHRASFDASPHPVG